MLIAAEARLPLGQVSKGKRRWQSAIEVKGQVGKGGADGSDDVAVAVVVEVAAERAGEEGFQQGNERGVHQGVEGKALRAAVVGDDDFDGVERRDPNFDAVVGLAVAIEIERDGARLHAQRGADEVAHAGGGGVVGVARGVRAT